MPKAFDNVPLIHVERYVSDDGVQAFIEYVFLDFKHEITALELYNAAVHQFGEMRCADLDYSVH